MILAMMAALTAAASQQQFDLLCAGTEENVLTQAKRPYAQRFIVDLGTKQWCYDSCEAAMPLADVTPTSIVFSDDYQYPKNGYVGSSNFVNRTTGEHVYLLKGATMISRRGTCEKAPFSGFPLLKTKF